jgi:signal transduction histidine kinase
MFLYASLLLITGLVTLGLAAYAWPRREEPGVGPFIVAAAAGSLWPLLLLVEMALPGVEAKSWVVRVRPALITTAISAMLVMGLRHVGWTGRARLVWAGLAPMPVALLVLNFLPWTKEWFQYNFRLHTEIASVLAFDNGPFSQAYRLYVPGLALAVIALLLGQAWVHRGLYRRRALLLALGVAAPTALYVLQVGGMLEWTAYNLPPLGMAVTAACGAWVLLREDYLDLVPVARAALVEGWPEPVVVVNGRHQVVDANRAAVAMLGAEVGRGIDGLSEPWGEILGGTEGREAAQGEVGVGDSRYRYETFPLEDPQYGWQGWVLSVNDVTERARAREAEEKLTADLKEETRQRQATEARLLEAHRVEMIGRLSGGVAHEFNNLTMVINGYANLVLSRLAEDDPNRAAIESIAQAGEDAARLTAQLLDFSRKQVMQSGLVDMLMLVREARHMWSTLLGERIRLKFEAERLNGGGGTWVMADAAKLREALTQLILNARDAMANGGVVTLRVERVELRSGSLLRTPDFPAGQYVRVSIADTGVGMGRTTLARALEPFFSTKEVGQGSGLGLSSAYGIVRQCGGAMELESVEGAGTTVTVYVPAAAGEGAAAEDAEAGAAREGKVRVSRVLVVEDQPDLRELLRLLLEEEGLEVQEAAGAAAALQIIEGEGRRPDLVITDLVMPGLSGHELVRRMQAQSPGIPVLVISGYSDEEAPAGARLLRKPFSADQLTRAVERILQDKTG